MNIHQAIILPGDQMSFYCRDGLSSIDVYHIEHIWNFGGVMKMVDCGPANQFVALHQAEDDMMHKWMDTPSGPVGDDFYQAWLLDDSALSDLKSTKEYKDFFGGLNTKEAHAKQF